jgi:hypothetical protein
MRTLNVTQGHDVCAEEMWLIIAVITRISKAVTCNPYLCDTQTTSGQAFFQEVACFESRTKRDIIEDEFNNAVKLHWRIASMWVGD